jgi:hypothetical protein
MFTRVVSWPKTVAMVCDVAKGTASISLRHYATRDEKSGGGSNVTGWDYHQIQAHGHGPAKLTPLVQTEQLSEALLSIASIGAEVYAYEVDSAVSHDVDARKFLSELPGMTILLVTLTVGTVSICWFVVGLEQNRDIIHWKMRYHERDVTPAS